MASIKAAPGRGGAAHAGSLGAPGGEQLGGYRHVYPNQYFVWEGAFDSEGRRNGGDSVSRSLASRATKVAANRLFLA